MGFSLSVTSQQFLRNLWRMAKLFSGQNLSERNARQDRAFPYLIQDSTTDPHKEITMVTVDDRRETVSLIGSDKVEGTAVYDRDDTKIGTVQRVMIDKINGKVAYAVVSFGGFVGIGEEYF